MLTNVTKVIQEIFELNQRQARGFLALTLICVIILFVPLFIRPYTCDFQVEIAKSDSLLIEIMKANKPTEPQHTERSVKVAKPSYLSTIKHTTEAKEEFQIELNSTDSLELQRVYGIGPVLASRIIRFRDKLGGFYSINQVDEVYGLSEEVAARLKSVSIVDTLDVNPTIDLASQSFKELLKHPYLTYEDVKKLINFRDSTQMLTFDEMVNKALLSRAKAEQLRPYIVEQK